MTLWLVRAGGHGEFEQRFLDKGRVYLTWRGLNRDLSADRSQAAMEAALGKVYPEFSAAKLSNHTGQIWAFSHRIERGDWVVLPSKQKPAIHIGKITGPYVFDPQADDPFYHYHTVKWIEQDIPRSNFDQDLLYSFGAFMTICRISRNDAERRVREMRRSGWKSSGIPPSSATEGDDEGEDSEATPNLAQVARDQIAKLILAKFKGHGMARLVDSLLQAQGYTTHLSPEGPDKGIDILAAPGPMGFGQPRVCVQVKSGDSPLDRPTLDQLIGVMQNVQAEQGLLVSWGGFKATVNKEEATQFFRVRLWDQDDLIDQLLANYDRLDDDVRADLPLKRIWTISIPDEDAD